MTTRKPRERDWNHDETLVLAEERRRNNKDGVWNAIAEAVSNRLPEQEARSADACQNRWDILRKLYNRIERCCKQTIGGHHLLLSEDDFKSMQSARKLPTAYRSDWYIIVKEVYDCKLAAKLNANIQPVSFNFLFTLKKWYTLLTFQWNLTPFAGNREQWPYSKRTCRGHFRSISVWISELFLDSLSLNQGMMSTRELVRIRNWFSRRHPLFCLH